MRVVARIWDRNTGDQRTATRKYSSCSERSNKYRDATTGGFALGNIGTEWAIPTAVLLVGAISMFRWFHVAMVFQLTYFVTTVTWSFLMFSYLHDVRHVENFWLAGNRWLKHWFTSARGLHDIHHATINDQELMNKNFGIGFFVFDHIFGSFLSGNSLSTTGDTRPCGGFAR